MAERSPRPSIRSWDRIDGIDLLRGLSILFVLMNHVNMRLLSATVPYTRGLPLQLVYSLVWNGQFGVQLFFVVSGYLITTTSMRRWGSPQALNIRQFYLLRFARIAPLLLLLLSILSALHLAHIPGYVVAAKTGGLPGALLAALTFHINLLEATRGYLPANWDILWSLSIEEIFYLFFPLFARLLKSKRLLIALLTLFILAGPFARARAFNPNPVWREYSYLGGMDAIALGSLTAILLFGRTLSRTAIRAFASLGSVLLLFILGFSLHAYLWGLHRNGLDMTVLALGGCLVIASTAQTAWQAPRLLFPLLLLGQRSYEIYLTHVFAVLALFSLFLHLHAPLRAVPVLFASTIAASGLLGWFVAIAFVEPMNRRMRRRFRIAGHALGAGVPEAD